MAGRNTIANVSWRDGRPRFQPGPKLRAAGYSGLDLRWPEDAPQNWRPDMLKHGDRNSGRWFSRGEALDWSDALDKRLTKALKHRQPLRRPAAPSSTALPLAAAPKLYTLEKLLEDWQRLGRKWQLPADPHELRRQQLAKNVYSPKTVREYRQRIGVALRHEPALAASPVDALTQEAMAGYYEELVTTRGLATARGTIAVLQVALAWGRRLGKFTFRMNHGVNPARDLGMSLSPPRLRIGSKAEVFALTAAADALGWPEMGDMVQLGLWTGQRQEDRLLLVDKGLVNGRRIFKQMKTGAIVAIREAPELARRLKASQARRAAQDIVNPRVVMDEQVWHGSSEGEPRRAAWESFPDDGDRYRKRFAELRAVAAAGIEGKVKPCPSLLGDPATGILKFHEADLRATAVTWMASGGSTIPEIISVTGHTPQSATQILKHYLATHPEMADSAIAKMIAFFDGDSEAEFGL